MNHWILPLKNRVADTHSPISFSDEYVSWWSGDPKEREIKYKKGDVVFFKTEGGKLEGWGSIANTDHVGKIEADDDEEGHVPPFYVRYTDTIAIQPRVIFRDAISVPDYGESDYSLNGLHARALNRIVKEQSVPSIITLEYLSPELVHKLAQRPEELRTLNWRDFEKFLARLLEEFGYEIDLRRGTKDGGIDLFALSNSNHPLGPHKYLLQAKRWKNSVGIAHVRELKFLHDYHSMSKSCLVTTSNFTSGAWKLANEYPYQLTLRDLEGIKEWVNSAWNINS